ncbi:hypothetical protein BS47DRAFT_1369763 [Hydnum rufescens UP504]|uniref:Uncharacterized protein n=1 Tax=Hydnum rufescens UP504 TaxID=1448309 RepID=A0A9P6ADH7_9AGAM|nr:hypothetical protein BS47DRAFT_1369763 [Hydnum rufescens UP504]
MGRGEERYMAMVNDDRFFVQFLQPLHTIQSTWGGVGRVKAVLGGILALLKQWFSPGGTEFDPGGLIPAGGGADVDPWLKPAKNPPPLGIWSGLIALVIGCIHRVIEDTQGPMHTNFESSGWGDQYLLWLSFMLFAGFIASGNHQNPGQPWHNVQAAHTAPALRPALFMLLAYHGGVGHKGEEEGGFWGVVMTLGLAGCSVRTGNFRCNSTPVPKQLQKETAQHSIVRIDITICFGTCLIRAITGVELHRKLPVRTEQPASPRVITTPQKPWGVWIRLARVLVVPTGNKTGKKHKMTTRGDTGPPNHWILCPVVKNQVPERKDERRSNPGAPAHQKLIQVWVTLGEVWVNPGLQQKSGFTATCPKLAQG